MHRLKEEQTMSIFTKKSKLLLYNERQKDEMIEKLEKGHIEYRLREKSDMVADSIYYELVVAEADLKKIS